MGDPNLSSVLLVPREDEALGGGRWGELWEQAPAKEKPPALPPLAFRLVSTTNLAIGVEYAILMPTAWEYVRGLGGSKLYLGVVLAAFSATRTLLFPLVGSWSDHRCMKEPFLFSFAIGMCGNFLYGAAQGFDSLSLVLVGRLVAGMGASNTALVQAFIAKGFPVEDRTKLLSQAQMMQLLGTLLGPALSVAFAPLEHHPIGIGKFQLNPLTAAGYAMVVVNGVLFVLFARFFVEPPLETYEQRVEKERIKRMGWWRVVHDVMVRRCGWYCLLISFITGFEMTALETGVTPVTHAEYGWGALENASMFSLICVVAGISLTVTVALDKRGVLSSRGLIALSFVFTGLGFVFGFALCSEDVPLYGLTLFGIFYVFGIIMQINPSLTIYTDKISEYGKGLFMGYSQMVLGFSRILGPLLAGVAIHWGGTWHLLAVLCAVFALAPIAMVCVWDRLAIRSYEPPSEGI